MLLLISLLFYITQWLIVGISITHWWPRYWSGLGMHDGTDLPRVAIYHNCLKATNMENRNVYFTKSNVSLSPSCYNSQQYTIKIHFIFEVPFPLIIQFIPQHNNIDWWKVYCILIAMNIFLILTYVTKSSLKANHWLNLVKTALEAWIYCQWFRGNSYWSILIAYIIESLQHLMKGRSWWTI